MQKLNSLCRLCGERTQRVKKDKHQFGKRCSNYSDALSNLFAFDVSLDDAEKHSQHMCQICYWKVTHSKKSPSQTTINRVKESMDDCLLMTKNLRLLA